MTNKKISLCSATSWAKPTFHRC